jgi:hypothetical protein|uniref:ATPase AAA-type core domain-containing protein n=1 Tax=viral metagenome TaxID=1070528 RepID=A0A6C0IUP0_9ZZZZ
MPKDKADTPKKSRGSKMKRNKSSSSDDESDVDIYMNDHDEIDSEEEIPKSGTKEFSEMFRSLGRKYSAKKDEENKRNKKKRKNGKVREGNKKKPQTTIKKKSKTKKPNKKKTDDKFIEDEIEETRPRRSKRSKKKPVYTVEEYEDEDDESEYDPEYDSQVASSQEDDEVDEEMVAYLESLQEEEDNDLHNQAKNILDNQFNIIFTTQLGRGIGEEESEEESEGEVIISSDEEVDENKDSTMGKSDEKKTSKNEYSVGDKVFAKLEGWDKPYPATILKTKWRNPKSKNGKLLPRIKLYDIQLDADDEGDIYEPIANIPEKRLSSYDALTQQNDIMLELEMLINARKKGGKKALYDKYKEMAEKKEQIEKEKQEKIDIKKKASNLKKFKKLLRGNTALNEFKYFKGLSTQIQKKLMKKLKEVNNYTKVEVPYKVSLIEADIPVRYKSTAMKKLETLQWMDPGSGEYYKIKQWVDAFMKIPFNKYNNLPVSFDDGEEKYNEFMECAKTTLDEAVYGMDDAKMQIMQLVGQWISNPNSIGTAVAIGGPPGTGKTTLLKEGVSKILGRPFAFIALGGATDSSFLEGHSYTYEGSVWGQVVDIIIRSKCMNPVIYFDELDKISNTPRGKEIVGILTHLTDTAQNDKFHDKYFSGIDFDLSKVLFIFSYNDESKIDSILKDRMYRINTDGYKKGDKCIISQKYLLPKIIKTLNFKEGDIIIPDETIGYISDNLVNSEKGVRNLKRALEIVYTKLNLYRLMKSDSKLFEKETSFKVEFPFTVTVDIAKKLVKKDDRNGPPAGMYV